MFTSTPVQFHPSSIRWRPLRTIASANHKGEQDDFFHDRSRWWATPTMLLVTVGIALSLVGVRAAYAHTHVAESTPADGEVLEKAPSEVSVRFGEALLPVGQPAQVQDASLVVLDACGKQVDNKDSSLTIQDSKVVVTSGGDVAGRYEVHWFATAADGAPQSGVLDFEVTKGKSCTEAVREDEAKDVDLGTDVTKLQTSRTKGGALVQVGTKQRLSCTDLAAKGDSSLELNIDTSSDRESDLIGRFVCQSGDVRLKMKTSSGKSTGSLPASITSKGLKVKLPRGALVGNADAFVQSSLDSDECADKVCADRAPDLGFVQIF